MEVGYDHWPKGRGRLLFHEYPPGIEKEIPAAEPAWRFLLE
jgi:hypothetical protein